MYTRQNVFIFIFDQDSTELRMVNFNEAQNDCLVDILWKCRFGIVGIYGFAVNI